MPLFGPGRLFKLIQTSTSQSFPKTQIGLILSRKIWGTHAYAQHVLANLKIFNVDGTNERENESEDKGFKVTYHPEFLMKENDEELDTLRNEMSGLSVARRTRSKTNSRFPSPSKHGGSRSSSPTKKGSRSLIKKSDGRSEWHGPTCPRRSS